MLDLLVLNVGHVDYANDALPVLEHYAAAHGYRLHVWTEPRFPHLHPSWYKMACHDLIDSDFILCWDLDLLPLRDAEPIHPHLDRAKFNLAVDELVRVNGPRGDFPSLRYNCGLIGVPRSERDFCAAVFTRAAEPNPLPWYEQVYFNDAVVANGKDVHVIPTKFNAKIGAVGAANVHYTYGMADWDRTPAIARHRADYFRGS